MNFVSLPSSSASHVGAFLPSTGPFVCGGLLAGQQRATSDCYSYSFATGNWIRRSSSLMEPRFHATSVLMPGGPRHHFHVFGGTLRPAQIHRTSEVFIDGNSWWQRSHPLPVSMTGGCAVAVNETHLFMAGGCSGRSGGYWCQWAWLLEVLSGRWLRLPDLSIKRYHTPGCGIVNGVDVVVAGGRTSDGYENTTEIFSLVSLSWRQGPRLPARLGGVASVTDGPTFILVGGITVIGSLAIKIIVAAIYVLFPAIGWCVRSRVGNYTEVRQPGLSVGGARGQNEEGEVL